MWFALVFHTISVSPYLVNLSVRSIRESTEFKEIKPMWQWTLNRVHRAFDLINDVTLLLVLEALSKVWLTLKCSGTQVTYDLIKHICWTLDIIIIFWPTLCATLWDLCLYVVPCITHIVTFTSHPVQASSNPSVNCEYSKFPVAATLSKHLFFFNQTCDKYQSILWTNKSESTKQTKLMKPKESDWLLYWCSHSVSASLLPQSQST